MCLRFLGINAAVVCGVLEYEFHVWGVMRMSYLMRISRTAYVEGRE